MKRGIFWLIVSVVTFGIGLTSAFLWLGFYKTTTVEPEIITLPTEIPTVNYCEMLNNPDQYDDQIVRLSHKIHYEYHGLVFDANCNGETKSTAVIISHPREADIFHKLEVETGVKNYGWGNPQVTVIGKFSRRRPRGARSNLYADTLDFRFEIVEVEKAVKD
jgi:hypothetical protein